MTPKQITITRPCEIHEVMHLALFYVPIDQFLVPLPREQFKIHLRMQVEFP